MDPNILSNYTVLFVDDDESINKLMVMRLSKIFKHVYSASNGVEALLTFDSDKPDIVITDINMPLMNGIDLIKEIRIRNPLMPILSMTAYNTDEYRAQLAELGVPFLVKPVKKEDIIPAILAVMNLDIKKAA